MPVNNKAILQEANAAIMRGDIEGFLSHCTDDTIWEFVGDQTLKGKDAVRQYMKKTYIEPPKFDVVDLIADDDFVTAVGNITLKDDSGTNVTYAYCDVWRLRDGKLAELRAFVVPTTSEG